MSAPNDYNPHEDPEFQRASEQVKTLVDSNAVMAARANELIARYKQPGLKPAARAKLRQEALEMMGRLQFAQREVNKMLEQ